MNLVLQEPFHAFEDVHDRMFGLLNNTSFGRNWEEVINRDAFVPSVDVHENADRELVFAVDLPGMRREDIDVTLENKTLTIRGERKKSAELKEGQYQRSERAYGCFSRSFSLPETVDSSKVCAEYKNGVLSLTLPMKDEVKPKRINVKGF